MVSVISNYHITGRCGRHRWMRWEKRGFALGAVRVGLRAPKDDDFCGYCRRSRCVVEAVSA